LVKRKSETELPLSISSRSSLQYHKHKYLQTYPSTFKQDHGIQDKKMILGVASVWNEQEGLNDFIELSRLLEENTEMHGHYKIVLVGLSDSQIKDMSKKAPNILVLPRTNSAKDLAEIYTAADVFVNPSHEETFGITTAEAQACGTYSIIYKDTACEEIINQSRLFGKHLLKD